MQSRLGIALAISAVLAAGTASPAQAAPWAGSCALVVTFNFATPVWGAEPLDSVSVPSYSISVAPGADLDPLTGGTQPCAVAPGGTNPFRTTSVTASGSALVWTCEAAFGTGGWIQGWSPSPRPSHIDGSHLITGGPDALTLKIQNPSLTSIGIIELVIHPDDALKLAQCETSSITSLKMAGVLEFTQR